MGCVWFVWLSVTIKLADHKSDRYWQRHAVSGMLMLDLDAAEFQKAYFPQMTLQKKNWIQMVLHMMRIDIYYFLGIVQQDMYCHPWSHFPKSLESFFYIFCLYKALQPSPGDVFRGLDPDRDPWRRYRQKAQRSAPFQFSFKNLQYPPSKTRLGFLQSSDKNHS